MSWLGLAWWIILFSHFWFASRKTAIVFYFMLNAERKSLVKMRAKSVGGISGEQKERSTPPPPSSQLSFLWFLEKANREHHKFGLLIHQKLQDYAKLWSDDETDCDIELQAKNYYIYAVRIDLRVFAIDGSYGKIASEMLPRREKKYSKSFEMLSFRMYCGGNSLLFTFPVLFPLNFHSCLYKSMRFYCVRVCVCALCMSWLNFIYAIQFSRRLGWKNTQN